MNINFKGGLVFLPYWRNTRHSDTYINPERIVEIKELRGYTKDAATLKFVDGTKIDVPIHVSKVAAACIKAQAQTSIVNVEN